MTLPLIGFKMVLETNVVLVDDSFLKVMLSLVIQLYCCIG